MEKKKIYSTALLICLFLFITSIPLERVISSSWVLFSVQIISRLGFFIFALYYIHKEELSTLSFKRLKINALLILPFLLLCFSNYFVALVQNSPKISFSTEYMIQSISVYAFTALNEELVFRGVLFPLFKKKYSTFLSMLYSSFIFGAIHLLNMNSLASIPRVLIQVLYCFGLGMLFSFLYMHTENILIPVLFHFLFNVINDTWVTNHFDISWDIYFFLINLGLALFFAIYGYFIFKKDIQKESKEN